jgi:beta-lactamase regulating signal transducer with metallopeptidase domain
MNPFGMLAEFVTRTDILRGLLVMTLSGAAVALLLSALKPLLRNRLPKSAQYYLWVVSLATFLVPVSAFITLPAHNSLPSISGTVDRYVVNAEEVRQRVEPYERVNDNGYIGIPAEHQETVDALVPEPWVTEAVDWSRVVWYLGCLMVFEAFWLSYLLYCETIIKRSNKAAFPAELNLLASLTTNPPALYRNPRASTPMLIRLFRPAIVLPDRGYTDEQLKSALLHELTHLRRKDIWIKWLTVLAVSVHWFNPVVWLMRREISRACELACDEAVIEKMDDDGKQSYGDTLIAVAATSKIPHMVLSTTMCEQKKSLKERLAAIMAHKKHTRAAIIVSVILIIAAIGAACAIGAGSETSNNTIDLQAFSVNGYTLGMDGNKIDTSSFTKPIPADRFSDAYDHNYEELRYSLDPESGVLRKLFLLVPENGGIKSLGFIKIDKAGDSEKTTALRHNESTGEAFTNISQIIGFIGEGKVGWHDREQGLRYVEYKQVEGRLSASVRFVCFGGDGGLVWVIAESSLPYPKPANTYGAGEENASWMPLAELPLDYSKEQAIRDGVYVNIQGAEIHNQGLVDSFYANALAGKVAFMRVMQYTIEGDPIIRDFQFDGETYTVTYDSTRDEFGSGDISALTYKYLLPTGLDSNGTPGYALCNAEFIGSLENGWIPSPSSVWGGKTNPPENPPEITVSANGKRLDWIVGINVWNGAIVDRAENFAAFMEDKAIGDLPHVSTGATVTVDFGSYPPNAVIVSESILNEDGAPKWRTDEFPKNYNMGMAGGIGTFSIEPNYATALSSDSADYEPGKTIKGYKLVCQWLKPDGSINECEYAFVIRSDPAITLVQEESATPPASQ